MNRREFVALLGDVTKQMGWHCYAWCLMDNHYHLLQGRYKAILVDKESYMLELCRYVQFTTVGGIVREKHKRLQS